MRCTRSGLEGRLPYLAAGDVSVRVVQQKGRWTSEEYKTYTVYNVEDAKHVSLKLSDGGKGLRDSRGKARVGVATRENESHASSAG